MNLYVILSVPFVLINKFWIANCPLASVTNFVASSIFVTYSIDGVLLFSAVSFITTFPVALVKYPFLSFVLFVHVPFIFMYVSFLYDDFSTNSTPVNFLLSTLSSTFFMPIFPTCFSFLKITFLTSSLSTVVVKLFTFLV